MPRRRVTPPPAPPVEPKQAWREPKTLLVFAAFALAVVAAFLLGHQQGGEATVAEPPAVEAPVGEVPVDEPPVDEVPVDEAPVDEVPVDETPMDEAPVDEAPVDETPVDEAPADEPEVTPVPEPTPSSEEPSSEEPSAPVSVSVPVEAAVRPAEVFLEPVEIVEPQSFEPQSFESQSFEPEFEPEFTRTFAAQPEPVFEPRQWYVPTPVEPVTPSWPCAVHVGPGGDGPFLVLPAGADTRTP